MTRPSQIQSNDSFGTAGVLEVGGTPLPHPPPRRPRRPADLPYSLRIVLENLLRHEDGDQVTSDQVRALLDWGTPDSFTTGGRPAAPRGCSCTTPTACPPSSTSPRCATPPPSSARTPAGSTRSIPAELVIDHSVIADVFGDRDAFARNVEIEYGRNAERYRFLKWGQRTLRELRRRPAGDRDHAPGQRRVPVARRHGRRRAGPIPDVCLGTDSHTTMVNGLGVLAWGIGGIEAEAVMLGQSLSMLLPPRRRRAGCTAPCPRGPPPPTWC